MNFCTCTGCLAAGSEGCRSGLSEERLGLPCARHSGFQTADPLWGMAEHLSQDGGQHFGEDIFKKEWKMLHAVSEKKVWETMLLTPRSEKEESREETPLQPVGDTVVQQQQQQQVEHSRYHSRAGISQQPMERTTLELISIVQPVEDSTLAQLDVLWRKLQPVESPCRGRGKERGGRSLYGLTSTCCTAQGGGCQVKDSGMKEFFPWKKGWKWGEIVLVTVFVFHCVNLFFLTIN